MRITRIGLVASFATAALAQSSLIGEAAEKSKPSGQGHDLGSWSKATGLDVTWKKKEKELKAKTKVQKSK